MLRIPITYDLTCQINQDMDYCLRNPEHCCIIRNNKVAAIVYLNPVKLKSGADLLKHEVEDVIRVVTENQYELEEEYRRILNGW